MENNLSFVAIFKESVAFFEKNAKNLLLSLLTATVLISILVFLPQQLRTLLISLVSTLLIGIIYQSHKDQEEYTPGKAINFIKDKFLMLFLLALILTVINVIGIFLLVIPGLIAMIVFQFAMWTLIFNPDMPLLDTLKHSYRLTKGRFWKIAIINLLAFISMIVLYVVFFGLVGLAFGLIGFGAQAGGLASFIVGLPLVTIAALFQLFFYLKVESTYQGEPEFIVQ
jgi:hypothetical protein